jgi:hypothetical protein
MSQPPPPPPPGAQPPPPPATGGSFAVGEAVSYGWTAYWKNLGPLILLTLIIVGINIVLSFIGSNVGGVVNLIVSIISLLVYVLLTLGFIRATIAAVEGRKPEVSMLFQSDGLGPYFLATLLVILGLVVGLILFIIPGLIFLIFLLIVWPFYGYVIAENPETGPIEALRRSAEITRGHRGQLLGLVGLLFLINIVGAIACGVGLLFTYGITAVAEAYAYKTLSGQPVAPV